MLVNSISNETIYHNNVDKINTLWRVE